MFAITERLLLRPAWPEDAPSVYDAIADECIIRNLARAPWPYETAHAEEYCARVPDAKAPSLMIFERRKNGLRLAGSCGFASRDNEVELGYWIARRFWNRGYATEAGRAVIAMARAVGHRRLSAGHFVDNPASGRVLQKLGFRATGRVERQFSLGRGKKSPRVAYERDLAPESDVTRLTTNPP